MDCIPQLTLIRALAFDIQGSYRPCQDRLEALIQLCVTINQPQWAQLIRDNAMLIYEDGRWFRTWPGPYGKPDLDDIINLNYDLVKEYWDLFHNPEYSLGFSSLHMLEYVQTLKTQLEVKIKQLETKNKKLEAEKQLNTQEEQPGSI